ncbi:MAG: cell division protein FtsQ/DivIB [Planktotalea sp.]|uniref:cell division protein FtsQ/DivIB n=1 Tax=Planktotalea sp. TaxID=2029877 RepID=UPI003C77540F
MQQVGAAGAMGQGARVLNRSAKRRKSDPAPSRWSYRFQRLMLTPLFRFSLRVGVPFALTCSLGLVYLSDEARRTELQDVIADMRASIEERPEFMIKLMDVSGASEEVIAAIHEIVPISFPVSSFDLELPEIQRTVQGLNPVRRADVRLQPGGVLQIVVDERETAALWRTRDGLFRIDEEGVYIGLALDRSDHPTLPILAGEGADEAVTEAKALMQIAAPLGSRVKGLVRMGSRRWDVVLDRDQRILLPEEGALRALERVIALDQVQDVMDRDLARVDMRLAHRPTIRMNENAVQELWRIKTTAVEASQND